MMDQSRSLQPSVQADEVPLQWAECYGKENNYIMMISHRQFNLRNEVTNVKESLTPNKSTMWGIVSIIHELAELLQQKNRERFVPANSCIYSNLWRVAMKLAFTDDQRGLTRMEKNAIHMQIRE